jgi:hypothetical protein
MTSLQKITGFLSLCLVILAMAGCDNTIKLAAPWKDIPVVYAILDPSQVNQYVRVEKVYLDPEQSAVNVAQIADSLYYPESAISVFLVHMRTGKQVQLNRIDGVTDGIPRKSGVFASQPNWLYKTATAELGTLQPGDSIRVEVRRTDASLPTITAATKLPLAMKIVAPDILKPFLVKPTDEKTFTWDADNISELFNGFVTVVARRMDGNNIISRDTVIWQVAANVLRGDANTGAGGFQTSTRADGIGFFQAMADQLDPLNVSTQYRLFEGITFQVVGGGKEIREFQISSNAASGVSGAEALPIFSNVTNGLGVVTAVNRSPSQFYPVDAETINQVKTHPLTKDLGFFN